MNTIRITFAALALAAIGTVHASEITVFPLEKGTNSRADVQADARTVRAGPGELYDGRQFTHKTAPASMKSREQVRMEARVSKLDATMRNDLVGGM